MSKEQNPAKSQNDSLTSISEELLANTLPPRTGPYRSLSAKRPRDPSHRKSVSFNDVPIVHEVPSHDMMRNSNCDSYRSWAYTDATPHTSVIPAFYSSQLLLPFNSPNAAAQKLQANRLSSTLYSTSTSLSSSSSSSTTNRVPDWAIRNKPTKATATTTNPEDSNTTNETNLNTSTGSAPLIIVHIPDERASRDTSFKTNIQSTMSSLSIHHPQIPTTPMSSPLHNPEVSDDKKHTYRSAIVPETEYHRHVPSAYAPLSDSAATYTSMISTNLIQSNYSNNEQPTIGYTRAARARSATLPINHMPSRANDTISITPFRATATNSLTNGSASSTRTVLRPTTIAFQCTQSGNAAVNIMNGAPIVTTVPTNNNNNNNNSSTTTATNTNNNNHHHHHHTHNHNHTPNSSNNLNNTSQSSITLNSAKPPVAPPRYGSAATNTAHSRFLLPSNRTIPTSSLNSSVIKYAFTHPTIDSTLTGPTATTQPTIPRPPATAYARSRSAHVLNGRRTTASPIVMIDGHSNGGTTTNPTTNLYATTKRNPNVRQSYGSYYMHRVLLPTTIH